MTEAAPKTVKPKTGKPPAKLTAEPSAPAKEQKLQAPTAKKVAGSPSSRASGDTPRDTGSRAVSGTVKVTQVIGTIARKWDQEATLRGLGLGKRHKSRVLQDTPEVRGMIYKVRHLIKVENA